jgi:integrase
MGHSGVTTIVKRGVYVSALRAGASEAQARARADQVASHSLRAGFVTSAARAKVASEDIALHVGWADTQMVARYMRQLDSMENNPAHLVLTS